MEWGEGGDFGLVERVDNLCSNWVCTHLGNCQHVGLTISQSLKFEIHYSIEQNVEWYNQVI